MDNLDQTKKELMDEVKGKLIEELNLEEITPEDIDDEAPLFGDEGLGLDSIDALEIILILEREYGIKIENPSEGKQIFYSENIEALQQGKHGIGKVTLFPTALDVPVSEVKRSNEELKQLLSLPPQRTVSRTALLGMIAAKEAMEDAGLNLHISSNQQKNQLPNQSVRKPRNRDDCGK